MSSSSLPRPKCAVIGLGISGLTSLKNLLELGFDATGYERSARIGGLWSFDTAPDKLTALKTTRSNGSKQVSAYQDFPFPDEYSDYPTATEVSEYLHSYAAHFDLTPHFRLNTTIKLIAPTTTSSSSSSSSPSASSAAAQKPAANEKYEIHSRDEATGEERVEVYDRVLVTTGPYTRPHLPRWEGVEEFRANGGAFIHGQAYKGPEPFVGKRVVVVGMGNTACDVATDLVVGKAEKVYLSHRTGAIILKRYPRNATAPLDHTITRRLFNVTSWVNAHMPSLVHWSAQLFAKRYLKRIWPEYDIDPQWRLTPTPPPSSGSGGAINEQLVPMLSRGEVISLHGIQRFTSAGVITLEDGGAERETACDAVVACTSAHFDYSILHPDIDPTLPVPPDWASHPNTNALAFPRLYQTLFHPARPMSLAFIGPSRGFSIAAYSNSDIASQAVGTVWKGLYHLPPRPVMEAAIDKDYRRARKQLDAWRLGKTAPIAGDFERWLCEVVGNQVTEKLGWGWEGWKFWWEDRKMSKMLVDGVNTPFVYRLWEGRYGEEGRKRFEGAAEAIRKVNKREDGRGKVE